MNRLLNEYDNGRRDVFFCLAVNLMDVDDLREVLDEADKSTRDMNLTEKSDFMKDALNECAGMRNISLNLRR